MNGSKRKNTMMIVYAILWCLSFVYYNIIISYSAAPASSSAGQSRIIAIKVSEAIDTIFDTSADEEYWRVYRYNCIHSMIRKLAHMTNFFIFSFINMMLFFLVNRGSANRIVVVSLIIGFFGGAIDEFTQLFVKGRSGQLVDVVVDMSGVCVACMFFLLLMRHNIVFGNKKVIF